MPAIGVFRAPTNVFNSDLARRADISTPTVRNEVPMTQPRLSGLTLLDFLILISIVAILTALVGPALVDYWDQTRSPPAETETDAASVQQSSLGSDPAPTSPMAD